MFKKYTLLSVTMVLTLATYTLHAQQSTEMFIPIGQSPGTSVSQTIIGKIEKVGSQKKSFTISDASGKTHTVKINSATQIWLDNTKLKKTNQIGSGDDCQPGRRAEVKYSEPERTQTVTAEWIKVEIPM